MYIRKVDVRTSTEHEYTHLNVPVRKVTNTDLLLHVYIYISKLAAIATARSLRYIVRTPEDT
jgi:hypothetical protein